MDKPSYTYNGGKSPHDLSHRLLFTSTVGQLLPVVSENLVPDDNVRIGFNLFTRIADVETSAFVRIREHIDVYFVPLVQLFSGFAQFIYGVGKPNSNFYYGNDSSFDHIPMISRDSINRTIYNDGTDLHGVSYKKTTGVLFDLLEYGKFDDIAPVSDAAPRYDVNPFKLLAYHKIFFDWFAIQDRTVITPAMYNIDNQFSNTAIQFLQPETPFTIHYRPWKRDFFTGIMTSPLESSLSKNAQSNMTGAVNDWLSSTSSVSVYQKNNGSPTANNDATNVGFNPHDYIPTGGSIPKVLTSAIRSIFAVERLLEITRRNGKNYADQTRAHFGASVPEGIYSKSYFVGSISQDLTISDVYSTAAGENTIGSDTNTSVLGQVGGKGVTDNPNNKILKFHAPCHGILMALYSAEPVLDYPSTMCNRQNLYVNREDYFTPEFDKLGMQPIFGINMQANYPTTRDNIYGWTYRYQELKQSYNRVTTGFKETGLSSWRTVKSLTYFGNAEKDFYVNPDYLDSIMLVKYDKSDANLGTDPLRHCLDIYFTKSSVMSNFSLPTLKGNF